MVDDRPEETGSLPDSERPKRTPPTIDLEATDVSTATSQAEDAAKSESTAEPAAEPASEAPVAPPPAAPISAPISPWIIAPVSGAVAAALVIGVGWMLGWPAVQPAAAPPAPALNAAAIDDLTARIAGLESKVGKPIADPAAAARVEGLEKSLAALRAQGDKLASTLNDVKSAPRADGAPSPDLSAIDERIAKVESQIQTQSAEIAQQGSKIADTKATDAKPADDLPLRRVVASALLDVLVRIGDPYPVALAAAKALAPNADVLKPLDQFADKGVPNANKLSTELLALVPKLLPAKPENATTGSGVLERLQAGAAKLVTIERTGTVGNDRGAVVARITAAALRNDSNEARRELKTLEPADRAAAQAWLEKADARDAALAASRQFAADAMAVLAKPAQ
ncbi:COG4223 family protein [Bradyrhizobium lablabi]|uniref:COG4223 family protein n=1 Tax=Bradyrhizobium lablabi TaxID=722472 RepID=UPI00090A659C|nr:hypothetical protein [Bradyrhizobium lablabi]SHL28854.1 Uncharacterized conserved protein [Bradyrhizobium lablabi]